ncbi:unnamed protein product, partial [Iphiclides podalirius]
MCLPSSRQLRFRLGTRKQAASDRLRRGRAAEADGQMRVCQIRYTLVACVRTAIGAALTHAVRGDATRIAADATAWSLTGALCAEATRGRFLSRGRAPTYLRPSAAPKRASHGAFARVLSAIASIVRLSVVRSNDRSNDRSIGRSRSRIGRTLRDAAFERCFGGARCVVNAGLLSRLVSLGALWRPDPGQRRVFCRRTFREARASPAPPPSSGPSTRGASSPVHPREYHARLEIGVALIGAQGCRLARKFDGLIQSGPLPCAESIAALIVERSPEAASRRHNNRPPPPGYLPSLICTRPDTVLWQRRSTDRHLKVLSASAAPAASGVPLILSLSGDGQMRPGQLIQSRTRPYRPLAKLECTGHLMAGAAKFKHLSPMHNQDAEADAIGPISRGVKADPQWPYVPHLPQLAWARAAGIPPARRPKRFCAGRFGAVSVAGRDGSLGRDAAHVDMVRSGARFGDYCPSARPGGAVRGGGGPAGGGKMATVINWRDARGRPRRVSTRYCARARGRHAVPDY